MKNVVNNKFFLGILQNWKIIIFCNFYDMLIHSNNYTYMITNFIEIYLIIKI